MHDQDRRNLLKLSAAVPLGAGALSLGGLGASAASHAAPQAMMPKPDHILEVRNIQKSYFSKDIAALLVNETWPGTAIRYTKGEPFRVVVKNLLDEPTSIHWHGLILPNLLDGVPEVTQAPIEPGALMYYEFPLVQAGSYWYHSHYHLQEQQGLAGPIIIEDSDEKRGYDHDVTVFLSDVLEGSPNDLVKGLQAGKIDVDVPDPYILPGEKEFETDIPYLGYLINGQSNDRPWHYAAKAGQRLRLRLINGSTSSFFRIMINGLPLTVIASDGEDVEPVMVDNLMVGTAERYDVLVTLPESGSYTLHAAALGDDKQVVGILHTEDAAAKANMARPKFTDRILRLDQLVASEETNFSATPDRTIENRLSGDMKAYEWEINDVRYPEVFAGEGAENIPFKVGYGEVVRFVIDNPTPMYHPMHLHGHVFRVLNGQGAKAPRKDTLSVAPKSKVNIEFLADNPGKWFWHCHNLYHLATGMAREVHYVANP